MATRFVTVQTTVKYGDGSIWPNAKFQFWLSGDGLSSTAIVPQSKDRLVRFSDAAGRLSIDLWDNSEGLQGTEWHCKHPSGNCFHFTINATTPDPVELSVLEQAGVGPSDPNYDTIFDAIANANQIELPTGGGFGDALVVLQQSPRVLTWGGIDGGTFN